MHGLKHSRLEGKDRPGCRPFTPTKAAIFLLRRAFLETARPWNRLDITPGAVFATCSATSLQTGDILAFSLSFDSNDLVKMVTRLVSH